jgi:exosortase
MTLGSYFATLRTWRWMAVSVLVFFVGLFGLVPYNIGWGDRPISVFHALWNMWTNSGPDWEHCGLVPLIIIGLLYWKREELGRVEVRPWGPSVGLLPAFVFLYWVGSRIDLTAFSFLLLHFSLGLAILHFLGWPVLRAVLLPFLFLGFAWPFPFLESMVAFPLRLIMSQVSYVFLNLIGIDCLKIGTAIVSAPDHAYGIAQGAKFAVDIANPCSGIRSLFALMMISALGAMVLLPVSWKQLVIFLTSIPMAVAGNFVRILMLTFGTLLFGSEVAIGTMENPSTYHMVSGFVVFAVAIGGQLLVGWLLTGGWRTLIVVAQTGRWPKAEGPARAHETKGAA